jgi:hypothetical protein
MSKFSERRADTGASVGCLSKMAKTVGAIAPPRVKYLVAPSDFG